MKAFIKKKISKVGTKIASKYRYGSGFIKINERGEDMKYSNKELMEMYENLVLGRIFDDVLWVENQRGRLYSMFHLTTGQEAIGTAAGFALKDDEPFMPSHRCRSLHLKRLDIYKYLAEQQGCRQGYCMGISGDPHITVHEKGFIANPGVLGQGCPIATGYAFALKKRHPGKAMVQLMGDGTFSQGAVYEAMNWAVVKKLPIVYVIENNLWAMSTPQDRYAATERLADRAKGLGMDVAVIDGNDLLAMREAMDAALERARINSTPTMIEALTYRVTGHFAGDVAGYRDNEYHEEMLKKHPDPIPRYEQFLIDNGVSTREFMDEIKARIRKEVEDDCEQLFKAKQAVQNLPSMNDILDMSLIYANPMEGLL